MHAASNSACSFALIFCPLILFSFFSILDAKEILGYCNFVFWIYPLDFLLSRIRLLLSDIFAFCRFVFPVALTGYFRLSVCRRTAGSILSNIGKTGRYKKNKNV
jgi:hypothetical protein